MKLSVCALLASAAVVGAAALPGATATAADDPTAHTRHGEVLNILPPGSRGNVDIPTLLELGVTNVPNLVSTPDDPQGALATASATTPANFADQLEMYDGLSKTSPGQLDEAALTKYFKDGRLGVADADVVSTETPKAGVTIKRDKFGVPHITGTTYENTTYGAGYANIQDRMFLTDILRHTGAARMAEFVGPTEANIHMDQEQLRIAPYTVEQAQAQIGRVTQRYGAEGEKLLRGLDAMLQGMNDAQDALCPLAGEAPAELGAPGVGFGPNCPVEYAALQKAPTPYTRADIVYIASLVGGIFGKGGGGEAENAIWYQQLKAKYGDATARKVFDDLREKNDPEAPTSSPTTQTYGGGGVNPTLPGVALIDEKPTATAAGSGSDAGGSTIPIPAPLAKPSYGLIDGPFGPINLGLEQHGMSNALLVDGKHSSDGHPTVVFGPQTGYFTPQLLVEQDLQGPGISARGVSFAGTNLVVELGHGVDYAWSATSASNDIVDTVVERLCNVDGSAATVESTAYLVGGTCTAMEQFTHSETAIPNAASQAPPTQLSFLVLKTRHGVVQIRTTVAGKPVAVVIQRSTYNHEIDSAVGFARLQNPDYVHDVPTFQKAVSAIDYTFNWFYVDSKDIGYYSSGLLPDRAPGWDWDLPHWGDTAYDDRGYLPFDKHVRAINPAQGYLVSWNNKPAPGFSAADNGWGYGPVYRSLALEDQVKSRIAGGKKMTRPLLVDAMIAGGVTDVRAKYVLPHVLDVIGTPADAQDAKAVSLLRAWVAAGGQRVDRARTGSYAHTPAIDLLDTWWEPTAVGILDTTFSLPKDALRGTLAELTDKLPHGIDDHPRQGLGSAWNNVAWYGYLSKDLRTLLGKPVAGKYSRAYCGGGTLAACRTQLRASLHSAVQAALTDQSKTDVAALTYDKSQDNIVHTTAGVVGVRGIDWQNRPTFQQAVHFTTHRAVAGAAAPTRPTVPAVAPEQLPRTGLGGAVPVAATVLLGVVGALVLRRRTAR
ncbi:MAG: penicillin acylase family protein [Frankiaceae bacterium]|nr:penicillin acylase family protein [Frankiaceae bacterium]